MDRKAIVSALAQSAIDCLAKDYGFESGSIGEVTEAAGTYIVPGFVYKAEYQIAITFDQARGALIVTVR